MSRWCAAVVGVFVVLAQASAQPQGPFLFKLNVQAQGAPSPSLRYRLLPTLSGQKPDDAAPLYKKAAETMSRLRDREEQAKRDLFLDLKKVPKPDDLPKKDVARFLERYEEVLKVVDQAAHCEQCNWDIAQRIREQGAAAPIPEIQDLRNIAMLLSVRARLAMAEGRLDDALRDIQSGMVMAERVGEAPCLICSLVGGALANIMCVRLQELMERDKAPNLYWAWTDLPRPFFDLRLPLQGERLMVYASFPGGAEAAADPKAVLADKVTTKDLENFFAFAEDFRDDLIERAMPREVVRGIRRLDLGLRILERNEAAKKALIESGRPRDVVEAMPPLQVAILHGLLEYDRMLDDASRWQSLPFWEAYPKVRDTMNKARLNDETSNGNSAAVPIGRLALPAIDRVFRAQARTERRFALLRCAEAIRLHAAAHDGNLPVALADIKEVPVPIDPVTGHGFEYTVKDDLVTLYGPPLDKKEQPNEINSMRVELTFRR